MCMYWGLRGPNCVYGGKSYGIDGLLLDPHLVKLWYLEPHLEASLRMDGDVIIVKGAFKHRSCTRVSMPANHFWNSHVPCVLVLSPNLISNCMCFVRNMLSRKADPRMQGWIIEQDIYLFLSYVTKVGFWLKKLGLKNYVIGLVRSELPKLKWVALL